MDREREDARPVSDLQQKLTADRPTADSLNG